jgi:hypothetical protein
MHTEVAKDKRVDYKTCISTVCVLRVTLRATRYRLSTSE